MKRTLFVVALILFLATFAYAADFNFALQRVILPHERGYQCIRSDNGNWTGGKVGKGILKGTMAGISAASYPSEDIKSLTQERVAYLYRRDYWDRYHLGAIEYQTVADRILDAMVNNGPIAAIWVCKAINRSNGVKKDVIVSTDLTMAKIEELNRISQPRFLLCFLGYRFARYDALADKYPQFLPTWLDREVDEIITAVHDQDALMQAVP